MNRYTAKLENRLTAKLVNHLTAKLVVVNLVKLHLTRFSYKEKRKQGIDFCFEQYKNEIRKGPVIYVVFVIEYFTRDQFTFLAKVNIRVKMFSVCSLLLMENGMFVKHVT